MIFEFALEPEVVATWGNPAMFSYFSRRFGVGTPRIMGTYPSRFKLWRRAVLKLARNAGVVGKDLSRVVEFIRIIEKHRTIRGNSSYDDKLLWLSNAEREHECHEFYGIMARENPRSHDSVIVGTIEESEIHPKWNITTQFTVKRNGTDITAKVSSILSLASRILFVDPNFGAENPRYRRTFECYLAAILSGRLPNRVPRLEIHTSDKAERTFFETCCAEKVSPMLPKGLTLRFVRWSPRNDSEWLHDRFVLTNLGGVKVQGGLDDGPFGQTTDIDLLSADQYHLRWQQYAGANPAFDLTEEPFEIIGSKIVAD